MSIYSLTFEDLGEKVSKEKKLESIKKSILEAYNAHQENVARYVNSHVYLAKDQLNEGQRSKLDMLHKPPLQFNMLEPYIKRFLGEFAQQEPAFSASIEENVPPEMLNDDQYVRTSDMLEKYFTYLADKPTVKAAEMKFMEQMCYGGFSVARVEPYHDNAWSFDYSFDPRPVFDPCMCFFDPLARERSKHDGRFCVELVAMRKSEFIAEFGEEAKKLLKRNKSSTNGVGGFVWAFKDVGIDEEIIVVAYYYEKKKRNTTIVLTSDKNIMRFSDYKRMVEEWPYIEAPPSILDKRKTVIEEIDRYVVCEHGIIEYEKTDYDYFPLIFLCGNDKWIKDGVTGMALQFTRPMGYESWGTQDLINFAGQCAGAELENMVMHKLMVAIEALPDNLGAYQNVQQSDVLLYRKFFNGDPEQPVEAPQMIQRTPPPQIISELFLGTTPLLQSIMGSYDNSLSVRQNDMSGKAIQQGSLHSAGSASPYLTGFIEGWSHIAKVICSYIPKYWKTPRTVPMLMPGGERKYQVINDNKNPSSLSVDFDPSLFNIRVKASPSTAVQKDMAIQMIGHLGQMSETMGKFFSEEGLDIILDNIDIRHKDEIRKRALDFAQKQKQMQAMMQQKQLQEGDPQVQLQHNAILAEVEIESARIKQKREKDLLEYDKDLKELEIRDKQANADILRAAAEIGQENAEHILNVAKHNEEKLINRIDKMNEMQDREQEVMDRMKEEALASQQSLPSNPSL